MVKLDFSLSTLPIIIQGVEEDTSRAGTNRLLVPTMLLRVHVLHREIALTHLPRSFSTMFALQSGANYE